MQYWRDMNAEADAGTLTVPEHVAKQCDAACVEYQKKLSDMIDKAKLMAQVQSFGDLPSAQALGMKFSLKASGKPDSLDEILKQHIAIIESLRTFFGHYFTKVGGIDDHTAGTIESLTPGN